jgi:hypothetical protein
MKNCKIYLMPVFILLLSLQVVAGEPDIYVDVPSADFRQVTIDTVWQPGWPIGSFTRYQFNIWNHGRGPLQITRIDITGDSDFTIVYGEGRKTLNSSESLPVVIQFAPRSSGPKTATVRIFSNDPDENPLEVPCTGEGVLAVLSITPTTLDFGSSIDTLTFKIGNAGDGFLWWTILNDPDKPWITYFEPANGGANAGEHWPITVAVDRDQLDRVVDTGILKIYTNAGIQDVTVQIAHDEMVSDPTNPSGPSNGRVGQELTFTTGGSTSNSGHTVEYQFDWGDGSQSDWGPATRSHSYYNSGAVHVKARGRCRIHSEIISGWSETTLVTIEESGSVAPIMVTHCRDEGPGSLREAINMANFHTGPDTIVFAIPEGVSGYQAEAGIWIIQPLTELPPIADGQLLINGFTQSAFIGRETNPYGPEIILDGRLMEYAVGIHVAASEVTIMGLTIHNWRLVGIWMEKVNDGYIAGCYIGTDHTGMESAPNGEGINIGPQCHHIYIAPVDTFRNIITGNINCGVHVRSSKAIFLTSNLVGLNRVSRGAPGNLCYGGFYIDEHCDSVVVIDNWMCGNTHGVLISNSNHNTIQQNWIGISPVNLELSPEDPIPLTGNINTGIFIQGESSNNLIYGNVIHRNGGAGVCIYGEQAFSNRISQNLISQNEGPGILYPSAGVNRISAPVITHATATSVSGTAVPHATIEIYSDAEDEGEIFQGATQSDADGSFSWTGGMAGPFTNITAIAIDAEGNTSQFSNVLATALTEPEMARTPDTFALAQNYPNPFNPATHIDFVIPHTVEVSLMIFDVQGRWISTLVQGNMQAGHYSVVWNGQNSQGESMPSSIYLYRLTAGDFGYSRKMILVR